MSNINQNNNGAFEPHQRNLGHKDFGERKSTETERIEGMGSISAADMIGLTEAVNKGYKHFVMQEYNTKGQRVNRSHMRTPADQANFSYGKNDKSEE